MKHSAEREINFPYLSIKCAKNLSAYANWKSSDFDVDTQTTEIRTGTTASFRNSSEHMLGVKVFRKGFDLMTAFGEKNSENQWKEMAIIPQSIVASSRLWFTVNSRCSLGFVCIASHIRFSVLSTSLLSLATLVLPLLPAYLSSFKLGRNYYILYHFNCLPVHKYYIFVCILFFCIGKYQRREEISGSKGKQTIFFLKICL